MKRPLLLTCLAAAAMLPLGACADNYHTRVAVGWSNYPYWGWYDGFYGPIYDGYWGIDNYFYYRIAPSDRAFRRGDPLHFHRDATRPNEPRYQRFEGTLRPPPQGTHMPSFRPPARDDRREAPRSRDRDRTPH